MRVQNGATACVIEYCVSEHWQEHGDHDAGAYEDCLIKTVNLQPFAVFEYDPADHNGSFITAKLQNEGLI